MKSISLRLSSFFGTYFFYEDFISSLQYDKSFVISFASLKRTKERKEQRIYLSFFSWIPQYRRAPYRYEYRASELMEQFSKWYLLNTNDKSMGKKRDNVPLTKAPSFSCLYWEGSHCPIFCKCEGNIDPKRNAYKNLEHKNSRINRRDSITKGIQTTDFLSSGAH